MKPNRKNPFLRLSHLSLAAPVALVVFSSAANAASITWENTGTDFNAGANWVGDLAPTTADVAVFTGAAVTNPNLAAPTTIQGINFSDVAAAGYTIAGSELTLTNTGTGATTSAVHAANNAGTNRITTPIVLGGAAATTARFNQQQPGTLEITGNISSTNLITGARFEPATNSFGATFRISGNNTYNGTTLLGWANIDVQSPTAFSQGQIVLSNNPNFINTTGNPITLPNSVTGSPLVYNNNNLLTSTGDVIFSGANGAVDFSGGNRTVTVGSGGGKLVVANVNVGAGNRQHQKGGNGIFSLSGTITGTGVNQAISNVTYNNAPWRINTGTLEVANKAVLGDALDLRAGLQASAPLTGANKITATIVHATNNTTISGANNIELGGEYVLSNGAGNRTLNVTNSGTTLISGTVSLTDHPTAVDNQNLTVLVDPFAGATEISGVIQNKTTAAFAGSAGKLIKSGDGTLTLSGANTFSGGLDITGGSLVAANPSALGASTNALTLSNFGSLRLNGNSFTVGTLSGTGGLIENGGAGNATITTNGTSGTFAGGLLDGDGGGKLSLVKAGSGTLTLSGFNSNTGDTTVNAGNTLELLSSSTLTFVLEPSSGVNNKLNGGGTVQLGGSFDIQLPFSNPPVGASWTVVDPALTESYLPSFIVNGWTGSSASGKWTLGNSSGVFTFSQATGVVSFAADSDHDGLTNEWETLYGLNPNNATGNNGGEGDPDGDGFNNLLEQAAGSNPIVAASIPGDADGDSLADNWEIANFGNLTAQNASGDPDGDGANNAAELAAGSSPTDSSWTPNKAKLAHRWNFNGNLNDSVGTSHATIVEVGANNVTQNGDSLTLAGGAQNASDYVNLGPNLIGGKSTPVTIELWATQHTVQNGSRIFSFGSAPAESLYMSWNRGGNGNQDRVEWTDNSGTSLLDDSNAPYALGTKYHIVMTLTPALYTNGELASGTRVTWYRAAVGNLNTPLWEQRGSFDSPNNLSTFNDSSNWLGRSLGGDNTANASFDEVRLWDGALTKKERTVSQAAGPNATNLMVDSDSDTLPDAWETAFFGNLAQGNSDSDSDGVLNAAELDDQSNPNNANSKSGDVDADGLADLDFETAYFLDLDENGDGDPDGDLADNELEESGGTNPTDAFSWPDAEDGGLGDGLNDGWEDHYFGDLDEIDTGDPDGDGEDNYTEQGNKTNPVDPFSRAILPNLFTFVDATKRNGSFELLGAAPGTVNGAKAAHWDNSGAGDVTYWTEWTAQGSVSGNSGVEGGGTNTDGVKHAFMEGGNAVYNLTDYIAAAGNIYWFSIDKSNANTLETYLVYLDAGGVIQPIASSLMTSTTASNGQLKGYQIPVGSPAIGRKIGIGFKSLQSWAAFDKVQFGVVATDADSDTYDDAFEDFAWGDNDGLVEVSDRAAGPAGDADGDGVSTLNEINGTLNTNYGNLPTKANDADSDDDGLTDGEELNGEGTNPNDADTDKDGLSDGDEVDDYQTSPLLPDSDGDGFRDQAEILYGSDPNDQLSTPDVHELIGLNKRNGSFELLGPVPGAVNGAKASHWDTDTDGDVTYWTVWTEQSTAENDSGTEGTGSTFRHGNKHAYIQNGNAVRNLTDYKMKAGDVIRLNYARTTAGNLTAYLIVNTGSGIVQIPGSGTQLTTVAGDGNELVFEVPAGHPNIGQTIGVAFKSNGGWYGVDKVLLQVEDRDTDLDGLSDFWEDLYFGNADDEVLAGELTVSKGTAAQALPGLADNDADGFNNEAEETAGSNPLSATSTPNDVDGDGLVDAWEITNFGSITAQTGAGDPDRDGTDNLTEFRLGLNPNDTNSLFKAFIAGPATITWTSTTGTTFKIERSTSMEAGSWQQLVAAHPGSAGTTSYTDATAPAGKAFYRVTLNN